MSNRTEEIQENLEAVEFNCNGSDRSDFATFKIKEEIKSFSHGDAFGSDGKTYWLDLNQNLDHFEDDEVSEEEREVYDVLREFLQHNFDL